MTACRRQHTAFSIFWGRICIMPAKGVEQAEPLFLEAVAALDALAPPLTEVTARTELHQLFLVGMCPARKAEIVILRGDPASARAGQKLAVLADVDLGIGAVDLLGDDDFAGPAGHLGEVLEFSHSVTLKRRIRQRLQWKLHRTAKLFSH